MGRVLILQLFASSLPKKLMRYCGLFLAGIPHSRVGHPLVTPPSATPLSRKTRTCDLHVLGTPPAFILSQDQTRHSLLFESTLGGVYPRCRAIPPNIALGCFA